MAYSDDLVEFLLQETGETLHVVDEYDCDAWQFSYVREAVRERIGDWELHADEFIEDFRREAHRNADRERLFGVGSFYCSLHLFDELLLVHVCQPAEQGIIFGYDPAAAAHLTAFVELCLPHVRQHALSGVSASPAWSE